MTSAIRGLRSSAAPVISKPIKENSTFEDSSLFNALPSNEAMHRPAYYYYYYLSLFTITTVITFII